MGVEAPGEAEGLRARVRELERRVRVLRTSRRVLMTLLSRLEQERREDISRLEREQAKLKRRNARYARLILERHRQVHQLERRLAQDEIASAGRDETAARRTDMGDEPDR